MLGLKGGPGEETAREVLICRTRNFLITKSLTCSSKVKKNGHTISIIVTTIMMKQNSVKELVKGTHNDRQHQNNAHSKTSSIDCDGVQCHMIHIPILWYRESCTFQLLYIWNQVEKNNRIVSSTPSWPHQLFVCICLLIAYLNCLECSCSTGYVYYNKLSIWTRTNILMRNHIIQPTGFGAYY